MVYIQSATCESRVLFFTINCYFCAESIEKQRKIYRNMQKIEKSESVVLQLSQLKPNNGQIEGLPKNPRFLRDEKFDRLKKSIEENPEMMALRELLVYPLTYRTGPEEVDEKTDFIIIGGNMRYRALLDLKVKETPCKIIPASASVEQLKAYTIKDNSGFGEWDFDLLANDWDAQKLTDWGLDLNFDLDGVEEEQEEEQAPSAKEDDYEAPDDLPRRTKRGDIWELGRHRLLCGDSTNRADVARLMGGAVADMVFADPPYGMKKEKDGVANDNLNFDDLLKFNLDWLEVATEKTKNNGSFYCFGIDEPLMDLYTAYIRPLQKKGAVTYRNLITWAKGTAQGQNSEEFNMYPVESEKCLFWVGGKMDLTLNADLYFEQFEPIRAYIEAEVKKIGESDDKIAHALGFKCGRTVNHWYSKSQFTLPTRENYEALRAYALSKNYDALSKNYDALSKNYDALKEEFEAYKKELYSKRAYFCNTNENKTDVWQIPTPTQKERELTGGHATPKPVILVARAIETSSREGEIVLDPFGGSGTTIIACEQLDRNARLLELDPYFCDVIINRWETLTGEKAKKLNL